MIFFSFYIFSFAIIHAITYVTSGAYQKTDKQTRHMCLKIRPNKNKNDVVITNRLMVSNLAIKLSYLKVRTKKKQSLDVHWPEIKREKGDGKWHFVKNMDRFLLLYLTDRYYFWLTILKGFWHILRRQKMTHLRNNFNW